MRHSDWRYIQSDCSDEIKQSVEILFRENIILKRVLKIEAGFGSGPSPSGILGGVFQELQWGEELMILKLPLYVM